jgi:hypothetical protein
MILGWRSVSHDALIFAGCAGLVLSIHAADTAGWQSLFDGKTTAGWHSLGKTNFPAKSWAVEDGCLHVLPKSGNEDIITVKQYDNFEFSCEWRASTNCNSGIKYLIQEKDGAIGPEYQILDDVNNVEARLGPKRSTASLYDVQGASNVHLKPVGEFNETRIRVVGTHVEHWLNGVKVLAYDLGSPELLAAIEKSKFKTTSFYGRKRVGHILLQDHGHEVWFRNIKIRVLP